MDLDRPGPSQLGPFERAILALPLVGSFALGLPLFAFPRQFASVVGLAGDDAFIYQLGGAAMIGYSAALFFGVRGGLWPPLRFVVLATYGSPRAFFAGFIAFAAASSTHSSWSSRWASSSRGRCQILVARRGGRRTARRGAGVGLVLALATVSAAVFGLGPQLVGPFAALMGYRGTDEVVYRLAGAACFGYAAMGIQELRSLHWDDMRLPNVMALVFNGLAFVAAVLEIFGPGRATPLAILVAVAAGFFTVAIAAILARRGR